MKKILFITGTRADYGKIKSLIKAVEADANFEAFIFVSGMHLIERLGGTYREVLKDGYKNVYVDFAQANRGIMSYDLGNVICNLTGYVNNIHPDMIVVHGDRIDAVAGAIVGALNNIRVAHIEGGELSGTIDESMRHAITKFAHIHLVCNEQAAKRLIQLGEEKSKIHVMGSPDIDIMLSGNLPTIEETKERYEIEYDDYAILMYHPVTTEVEKLGRNIENIVSSLIKSGRNYVVIYPNNDYGSEIILSEYERFKGNEHFRVFPSIRFEHFLTLLKNADFMIGNSSAGVRETGVYGIPAIDIGNRQHGRYKLENSNIIHVSEEQDLIEKAIATIHNHRTKTMEYGEGNSTEKFMDVIRDSETWDSDIQKKFIDFGW